MKKKPPSHCDDSATPYNYPSIVGNELDNIIDAVHRGQLAGDGYYTKKCEEWLTERTGSSRALLTHSCTAALDMAAILCDLKAGDEVIMPSFTFVSTANAVALRGATPVFVDIDPDTLNICAEKAQAAITPATKAIFIVHYAGEIAAVEAFRRICDEFGLYLVEDAAQALGSSVDGKQAGSFGDLATFSFHETKNVISGEGGALIVNNPALIERAEIIREKGTNRSKFFRNEVDKYSWVDIGSSFLPGELTAAFLFGQLEKEPEILRRRLEIWDRYDAALRPVSEHYSFKCPIVSGDNLHNGHIYYLLLPTLAARDAFIAEMKERNICTPFHFVPLHSSAFGQQVARTVGEMSVTNRISDTLVRLPLFYSLENQEHIIAASVQALEKVAP